MKTKKMLVVVLIFLVFISLIVYWFIPLDTVGFKSISSEKNYNFSTNSSDKVESFYENLRFPTENISYNLDSACSLNKKYDMQRAFDLISNNTVLKFYPVNSNEQISISCQDKIIQDESGFFVAGEGGPTKITQAGNYSVIIQGEILLIRDSNCPNPNIAIHELLHVIGFNHSTNSNNIMYPVTACDQIVSPDIYSKINSLYVQQPYPDLAIENVSATMDGKYLEANLSIENEGLANSDAFKLKIYIDGKLINEEDYSPLKIGTGYGIKIPKVWISQISVKELEFEIDTNQQEMDKENNNVNIKL